MKIDCEVDLLSGHIAYLSYTTGLIMLHTSTINAQWQPSNTAIELTKANNALKIGFYCHNSFSYQSWLFDVNSESKLNTFFTYLGYKSFNHNMDEKNGSLISLSD